MNICIVSDLFDSSYGGVPVVVSRFIGKLVERGHKVTVITSKHRSKRDVERRNNVTIYRFPSVTLPKSEGEYAFSFPHSRRIRRIYERESIDVVHCHITSLLALACVQEARKIGLPSVATNHMLSETFSFNLFFKSRRFDAFFYKILNSLFNRVDLVVCPSTHGLKTLREHGLNTKALVLSNGIELSKFNPKQDFSQFIREFGLKEQTRRILYVGRLMKEKGLSVLLKAYSIVHSKNPNTNLIIVGKGHLQKELERQAKESGLESVVFTGFIPDTLLRQAYASSDLFVLPSYAEIQPLVLLEALAMGLPAIGTDVGGIPEMIINGWNGYILKPGDWKSLAEKTSIILDSDELRRRFSRNSLQLAKSHDIEESTDELEQIYNELRQNRRECGRTLGAETILAGKSD